MESPCIDVCTMDPETQLCQGCGRTLAEIAGWSTFSPAERQRIMALLGGRMRDAGIAPPAAQMEAGADVALQAQETTA